MDDMAKLGDALPIYALGPIILIAVIMVIVLLWKTKSAAARFLIVALAARPILSSLHEVTFDPSPLGLSWNALGSIGVFAAGALIVRRRSWFSAAFIPFYPIVALLVLSAYLNAQVPSAVAVLIKYGYLFVIILATVDALQDLGPQKLFNRALFPLSIPIVMQVLALATGTKKITPQDSSVSYLGGFYHEAAFSMLLCASLLVVCISPQMAFRKRLTWLVVLSVALLLANYRTAIIAMIPLLGLTVFIDTCRKFIPKQRAFVALCMIIVLGGVAVGAKGLSGDRLAELNPANSSSTFVIKPPNEFSPAEQRVMSGRPYIWSGYVYAWKQGGSVQQVVGFGPESWDGVMSVYAHNTLVSYLYELGIFGVIALLFLWIWFLLLSLYASGVASIRLFGAHMSFIILNMSTMPMWMIDGLIYYGLVCGATVFYWHSRSKNHGVAREWRHLPMMAQFRSPERQAQESV